MKICGWNWNHFKEEPKMGPSCFRNSLLKYYLLVYYLKLNNIFETRFSCFGETWFHRVEKTATFFFKKNYSSWRNSKKENKYLISLHDLYVQLLVDADAHRNLIVNMFHRTHRMPEQTYFQLASLHSFHYHSWMLVLHNYSLVSEYKEKQSCRAVRHLQSDENTSQAKKYYCRFAGNLI